MAFAVEAIHYKHLLPEGKISSAAFKDERLSVNWERYSDAKGAADENSAAVAALVAGHCKALNQTVEHTPIEPDQPFGPNRAHSEVCGRKKGAISSQLRDIAKQVWSRPPEGDKLLFCPLVVVSDLFLICILPRFAAVERPKLRFVPCVRDAIRPRCPPRRSYQLQ
jgi:hypothetical protein